MGDLTREQQAEARNQYPQRVDRPLSDATKFMTVVNVCHHNVAWVPAGVETSGTVRVISPTHAGS